MEAKKSYVKEHFESLNDELLKIRDTIAFTPNMPSKQLVELSKKHMDIQTAARFLAFLDEQYNPKKDESKETSKLITM